MGLKAMIGDEVKLHYDTDESVKPGQYIQTTTGRTYLVLDARKQRTGKHAGRYHLAVRVVEGPERGAIIHKLFWYAR